MIRKFLTLALLLGTALGAGAQTPPPSTRFPTRPIRLIVPFPPGGGTDILARLVAQKLTEQVHWTIVPDNRAGAGGTIGLAETAKAAPTGYEMVMGQKDNMVVAPWLYRNVGYDPTRDLVAVAEVAYTPIIIVTSAQNPRLRTLSDLVTAARAQPDAITYGSPGNGTTIHLAGEIFKNAAGIRIRHVPYKGSNPALLDVLAGNIDLMVSSVPSVMGQIRAGKLRPLAVTSARRSSSLPDVPTLAELGYKEVDVSTWYGLFVPAGTPQPVIGQVSREVNRLLTTRQMQAAIREQGAEPESRSPEAFGALVRSDYAKWKDIVKASGATIE